MKTYTFIILLILACSQLINCGPLKLNSEYHSVYSYEVILSTIEDGTPKKQFSILSEFDLHPTSKLTYDITFKNVESKELADSIDKKLVEELKKKFSVTVIRLPVGEFTEIAIKFSDPKESAQVKNIKRGLIALLSVDYRDEATYKTTQSGLLGRCDNEYSVSRTPKIDGQSSIMITRTRIKDTCKASNPDVQEIWSDKILQSIESESKSDYYYELVETEDEVYIKHADLEERLSLRYNSFRNLTLPLISQQKVKLLSREKLGSNHQLRKRQFGFPIPTIPSFPRFPTRPFNFPTVPSITSIVNKSREAIDNAVHKLVDGHTTTTLEAQVDYKLDPSSITDVAERFNRLTDTLNVVETEDVEKLQLGYQYAELKNYLVFADKQHLLDIFKSDKIKAEPRMRRRIFFQILSLLPQHAAFQVAKEVTNNDLNAEEKVKQFAIDTMTVYFTSRTRKSDMTNEQANEVYQFCKESLTQNRLYLYKACYLYFSRMASMNYLNGLLSLKEVNAFQKSVISDLVADVNKVDSNESPVKLLLALKAVKNFRVPTGLDFVKKILTKSTHNHLVRADAAWGLMNFDLEPIKDDLINLLYNQTENTEIRLAIFYSLINKHGADLIPFVARMKLNFLRGTYIDDKLLVTKIYAVLRHALQQPTNERNAERQRNARMLYDAIREDYKEYLGYPSGDYHYKSYFNGRIDYFLFMINSKKSLIPETYYISHGDSFDSSQYVLRSLHGNLLTNMQLDSLLPEKSEETPDADIQDAILKMVQQLHLTLRDRVEHNYEITKAVNHYEVYFIYGDENNFLYPMDLIAFKGNGVHLKYSVFAISSTESGLPYYLGSEHLSITRIIPSNDGLNVLLAAGGYSESVVLPAISSSHLVSGKLSEETLRANIHLGFKAAMPHADNLILNGSISILNDGQTSTSLYYKSQRLINKVVSKNLLSLHLNEVDQFDAENYEDIVTTDGDFQIRSRYPIGRGDENVFHAENLVKGFRTIGSLVSRKKYNYDIKVTFAPNPPHRALIWDLDFLRDPSSLSTKLILSHDLQKLYSLWLRRAIHTQEREKKWEVVTKDFRKSYTTYLTATVKYPMQSLGEFSVKDILPNVQNATIIGAFYTGNDLLGELGKKPEDLYLSFNGIYSKRHDKREIKYYEKVYRFCAIRNDIECYFRLFRMAHKYNRLELDIDIAKTFASGEYTVVDHMSTHLFENAKSHLFMDPNKKTSAMNKARIEINLMKDLGRHPTVDYAFRRFWGEGSFKNLPANVSPFIFGYSAFEENLDISNKLPFYRPSTCYITNTALTTFDGNKREIKEPKNCNKPKLVVGDCSKFQFFVIRNENSATILYNHRHNVTFAENGIYVDGKQEEIAEDSMKQYTNFRVLRRKYAGKICQTAEFGKGLVVHRINEELIVFTNPLYKNQLCGICGNNDGDWSNDIVSSKNEAIQSDKFYESWSFGDDQKCT